MGSQTIVRPLGGTNNNRPPSHLSISKIALVLILFYIVVTLKCYSYLEVRESGSGGSWSGWGDRPSTLMAVQQQASNNINNNKDPHSILSYDVVTLVHHDDMEVLIQHGLDSYFNYLTDFSIDGRIFVIGTPQAIQKIEHLKENGLKEKKVSNDNNLVVVVDAISTSDATIRRTNTHCDWDRVVTVPEYLFPFSLQDAKRDGHKPTWVYQQFLKMYSYQVLSGLVNTPLKRHFLLVDSDTTFVRPLKMLTNDGTKMLYNIASEESGAFKNDVMIGDYILPLAFNRTLHKGFPKPTRDGMGFTSITHMMMMDGHVLNDMLAEIARLHRKPAWRALLDCCASHVTEWEFYMAYVMKNHRDRIGVRQLPYVNWGRVDDESLRLLRETKDVYYVSKHDDWPLNTICCVNSNWTDSVPVKCNCCCEKPLECKRMKIDCDVLGVEGCHQSDDGSGVMVMTFATTV